MIHHEIEMSGRGNGRAPCAPEGIRGLLRRCRRCGRRGRGGMLALAVIYQVLQLLAGLEERNLFGGNFHPVPGLGIASHARLALARAEASKTADLDLVTHPQRAHDAVKDRLYNHFAVFPCEFRQTRDLINQIRFCHTPLGSVVNFHQWSPGPATCPFCRGLHNSLKVKYVTQLGEQALATSLYQLVPSAWAPAS